MTEPDASVSGEEARLMKALQASASREKDPHAGEGATAKKPPAEKAIINGWKVYLEGLPTAAGAPVELLVANKSFLRSKDDGAPVTTSVGVPFQGFGAINEFVVKIPAMDGFEAKQKFKLNDGGYVQFKFTDQGLAVKQQKTPF